jgi:putative glutamine amidotransferase
MMRGFTPLIGITADLAGGHGEHPICAEPALFLPKRYTTAVERSGGVPLVLPFTVAKTALRRYLDSIDGLLISGGNFDIHPRFYGERSITKLGKLNPERTDFELNVTRLALDRDLPVLGICGGAQAINVVLGGSLYQDIASQCPGAGEHQQGAGKAAIGHLIELKPRTLLRRIMRRRALEVNTTHHQAVKGLGKGLIVNAVAADGITEGIESTRHPFVVGVQWHPERLAHRQEAQRRLLSAFLAACKRYRRGGAF